jgi:F0F1-type ATP synthase assembly protein I
MTGSVAFGVLVGMGLDHVFQTKPWLLIGGSSLGVVSGFTGFVLVAQRMKR